MKVYCFLYTDCVYDGYDVVGIYSTKRKAYKAMKKLLTKEYNHWYDLRIDCGKKHSKGEKFGRYNKWEIIEDIVQ
tara:strand:- start:21761 stop:21985 length:225 start_codon:yes stop_codon:yes gene_type:complete